MGAAVGGAAHARHSQKLADCDPNAPDPAEASPLSPPNGAVVRDPTGNDVSVVECVLCPEDPEKLSVRVAKNTQSHSEQRSQGAREGAAGWRCPHVWEL